MRRAVAREEGGNDQDGQVQAVKQVELLRRHVSSGAAELLYLLTRIKTRTGP